MAGVLPEISFQRLWRKLQQVGLNAYEARAYLVLVGHSPLKALELTQRAGVPRQKIYEVLDSLCSKGFASVHQGKTKVFSAVEPGLALPQFLLERGERIQQEFHERSRLASGIIEDLTAANGDAPEGRGTLDFVRILTEPIQMAEHYRRFLADATSEYVEFSRAPYAVYPAAERGLREATRRGVRCRLLIEDQSADQEEVRELKNLHGDGVEVRQVGQLPMKLALFDQEHGLLALMDGALKKPSWTALAFSHRGLGDALQGLFESHWGRSHQLLTAQQASEPVSLR